MYTYLLINIVSVLFPMIFSFHPKIKYYKKFSRLLPSILITALLFIVWDVIFTKNGIWGFNPKYLLKVYFFNLPVEELLFFICIPFASIFIYEVLIAFNVSDYLKNHEQSITKYLIIFSIIIAIWFHDKLYTVTTFSLLAIFLIFNKQSLSRFYFSYIFILIPFFIVNGILTGTGINEPIVWYNNDENLGLRIMTIPVEDTFYGMLMLMMSIKMYESSLFKSLITANR